MLTQSFRCYHHCAMEICLFRRQRTYPPPLPHGRTVPFRLYPGQKLPAVWCSPTPLSAHRSPTRLPAEIQPPTNSVTKRTARFCASHRRKGDIDLRSKRCQHPDGCMTPATYGERGGAFPPCAHTLARDADISPKELLQCPNGAAADAISHGAAAAAMSHRGSC